MSTPHQELRRLEARARERLGAHLTAIGAEAGHLATSCARRHPHGLVAAGGTLGFLLGAWGSTRREGQVRARRMAGIASRTAWLWILRKLAFD